MKWQRVIPLLAALGLGGCAVGPDYHVPELPTPASYRTPLDKFDSSHGIWWQGFENATLNQLVDAALQDNHDIGIAAARLAEAEAFIRAERADLFPSVDGVAQGDVQSDLSGKSNDSGAVSVLFSFIPDLFGGQRRRIENARALADAQKHTLEDVRRLTVAAVAALFVELRRSESRLMLLNTSLNIQNQTLEIVEIRSMAGLSPDLEVRRAAADLARTRAERGGLETARVRAKNSLAVLFGALSFDQVPAADNAGVAESPLIPQFTGGPPLSAPAALLRHRPDLRAAEAELAAATAAIGVETADLYPSLTLPAQLTANVNGVDGVGDDLPGLINASLDISLFDAGRRRAEVSAAQQRAQVAFLGYEKSLLVAVNEVETALATIRNREDQRKELQRAVEASEKAFEQLNRLYGEGLATFNDILDAQRTLISSREDFVDSEADLATAFIDLYRALGAPTVQHPGTHP